MQVIELEAGISSLDLLFVLTALGLGLLTDLTRDLLQSDIHPPETRPASAEISARFWTQADFPWRFDGPDVEIRGRLYAAGQRDG
jgi:hypothetical protein